MLLKDTLHVIGKRTVIRPRKRFKVRFQLRIDAMAQGGTLLRLIVRHVCICIAFALDVQVDLSYVARVWWRRARLLLMLTGRRIRLIPRQWNY